VSGEAKKTGKNVKNGTNWEEIWNDRNWLKNAISFFRTTMLNKLNWTCLLFDINYILHYFIVMRAAEGCFNCQLEHCFKKVCQFCHRLLPQIPKVTAKFQMKFNSNKINRGASKAISLSFIPITKWDATVKTFSRNRSYVHFKALNMCQPCRIIVRNMGKNYILLRNIKVNIQLVVKNDHKINGSFNFLRLSPND
jgi:hypothetical protein